MLVWCAQGTMQLAWTLMLAKTWTLVFIIDSVDSTELSNLLRPLSFPHEEEDANDQCNDDNRDDNSNSCNGAC